jgi:hypothetical protein
LVWFFDFKLIKPNRTSQFFKILINLIRFFSQFNFSILSV